MNIRANIFLTIAVAATLLLTACADNNKIILPNDPIGRPIIGLILKSITATTTQRMLVNTVEYQKKKNTFNIIIEGTVTPNSVAKQEELVRKMIEAGVDAIVIDPINRTTALKELKKAIDKGIPVVNIDIPFDKKTMEALDIDIPYIAPDNEKAAENIADYVISKMGDSNELIILEGMPQTALGEERTKGFIKSIDKNNKTLNSIYLVPWSDNEIKEILKKALTAHPGTKAVLTCTDTIAFYACQAINDLGLTGKVLVGTIGYQHKSIQSLITKGKVTAAANLHHDKYGIDGIELALNLLADREHSLDDVRTSTTIITAKNAPVMPMQTSDETTNPDDESKNTTPSKRKN